MIEALGIVGAAAIALALGVIAYLSYATRTDARSEAQARVDKADADTKLAIANYTAADLLQKYTAEHARANALEVQLEAELSKPPNPDLPPGDVHDRLQRLRLLQDWGAQARAAAAGAVAGTAAAVPTNGAADEAKPRGG